MILFLITFFEETFKNNNFTNNWNYNFKPEILQCSASHENLIKNCLFNKIINKKIELKTNLKENIELPLFIHFTLKSKFPTTNSEISLTFFSNENEILKLGFIYGDHNPKYFLNFNKIEINSGFINYDREITRSISLIILNDLNFKLYIDGMIMGNGTLFNFNNFNLIKINLFNGNTTSEIGNIFILNNEKQRWKILINTLLRFRLIERSAILKALVDEEELKLFKGKILNEPLDLEEEYGKLLTEEEADPRKFPFPWKLPEEKQYLPKDNLDQNPLTIQKKIEKSILKNRNLQEDEKEEL